MSWLSVRDGQMATEQSALTVDRFFAFSTSITLGMVAMSLLSAGLMGCSAPRDADAAVDATAVTIGEQERVYMAETTSSATILGRTVGDPAIAAGNGVATDDMARLMETDPTGFVEAYLRERFDGSATLGPRTNMPNSPKMDPRLFRVPLEDVGDDWRPLPIIRTSESSLPKYAVPPAAEGGFWLPYAMRIDGISDSAFDDFTQAFPSVIDADATPPVFAPESDSRFAPARYVEGSLAQGSMGCTAEETGYQAQIGFSVAPSASMDAVETVLGEISICLARMTLSGGVYADRTPRIITILETVYF